MSVTLEHLAAGCNRCAQALDWGEAGLLAFAAHSAVAVYDPQAARVLGTLLGHTDRVNCVRWLPAHSLGAAPGTLALASGAGDGTVRVWLWTPHTPAQPWRLAATLQGHAAPVTSLATLGLAAGGSTLLVSTAGDGAALVWECALGGSAGQDAWRLRQRIHARAQLHDCTALACLPADPAWLLLALGGVDGAVWLYACPPGGQFGQACSLGGHQDWVKGLAFAQLEDGKLLLASASQDRTVRVWAVTQQQQAQQQANGGGGARGASSLAASLTRYAPKPAIHAGQHSYVATLEALLIGHEDWVHSVAWHPRVPRPDGSGTTQPPCLLSASMDRTMMLWRPDTPTGLWVSEESVGDAGADHLGYYTGVFAPDGRSIAAHGFTGALHIWQRGGADSGWLPHHALSGHWAPVVDACWAADGACLLTVSTDQTARLTTRLAGSGHWCEVARPQVHGHDFSAVVALPPPRPGRFLYASGSEEKVIRVFEAPRAFHATLALARGQPLDGAAGAALGALLPALGLSNKAVYEEEEEGSGMAGSSSSGAAPGIGAAAYEQGPDLAPHAAPSAVAGPPLEEHLAQNTLWPEVHKLYGHGNDVYCLAADPRGRYLASACRAQSAEAATIWVWDTERWTGVAQLAAHTLTVTQLAFSPDGRFLASASRDRSVALFERQQEGHDAAGAAAEPFRLVARLPKAHARIVWGLHWSPDSRLLATASRDGKVKVWSLGAGEAQLAAAPAAAIDCGDSVLSVQFAPTRRPGPYLLAAGLESGVLLLVQLAVVEPGGSGSQLAVERHEVVWRSPQHEQHAAAVRRLCWQQEGEQAGGVTLLASCSDDHSLRIFGVHL